MNYLKYLLLSAFLLVFTACNEVVPSTPEVAVPLDDIVTASIGLGSVTQAQTTTSPLTLAKPVGVVVGDFMIAVINIESGTSFLSTSSTTNPTNDWTQLGVGLNHGGNHGMAIYWKFAGASEQSNYNWNTGGKKATGGIMAFSGVDRANPINQHSTNTGTASTMTANGVTTTVANGHLLAFFGTKTSGSVNHTEPAGMTRRIMTSLNDGFNTSAHEQALGAAGATGNRQSISRKANNDLESTEWVARLVALSPAPTVTVNKVVVNDAVEEPEGDPGLFNLRVNGTTHATDVGHDGTTGAITVPSGSVTVSELAGTHTDLADYVSEVSCDSDKSSAEDTTHTFNIAAGENVTCTITNTRKATLTIEKVIDPENDGGVFNLQIDGETVEGGEDIGHGGSVEVKLAPGTYIVDEEAGTGTDLDDYIAAFSESCANGSITLTAGQEATCTITNTRKATLTINKVVEPEDDTGLFNLQIDGVDYATDVSDGGTTDAVKLAPGTYTVSETAGTHTDLNDYVTEIGGDCAANGSITLTAGQNATCTITNTRKATPPSEVAFYLHNNPTPPTGNTRAQANLPLDTTAPTVTVLYNYATNLDSNTGVTGRFMDKISSSDALTTTDLQKYQTWRTVALGSDLVINGDVQLKIWAKMKASGKNIRLRAFLRDCNSTLSSCTNFATLDMATLTNASRTQYEELTVSAAGVNRTIAAGRVLQLRVVMMDISNADPAYLAYDTVAYPARLVLP